MSFRIGPVARRTRSRNVGINSQSKAAFVSKWESDFSRFSKIRKGTASWLPDLLTTVDERTRDREVHEAMDDCMKPRLLFDHLQLPSYADSANDTPTSRALSLISSRGFYREEMLAFHDGATGIGVSFASRKHEEVLSNGTKFQPHDIARTEQKSPPHELGDQISNPREEEENGSHEPTFVHTFTGEPQTDADRRELALAVSRAAHRAREVAGLPEPSFEFQSISVAKTRCV